MFTTEEVSRYSRHILLSEIGLEGQERLLQGKVLLVGLGGLGSPIALYLAAAGVGTLGLIDADRIELSNLQRQVIHFTSDVGRLKIESAKDKILQLNPNLTVNLYPKMLNAENAPSLLSEYDFIIDGTDHFATKFLINDLCVKAKKPFSHGGVLRFEAQTLTYVPGSACLRCLFNESQSKAKVQTCSQAGVIGAMVGVLGTIQALETVKFLTKTGDLLTNRLWKMDGLSMMTRTITIPKQEGCVCGG